MFLKDLITQSTNSSVLFKDLQPANLKASTDSIIFCVLPGSLAKSYKKLFIVYCEKVPHIP